MKSFFYSQNKKISGIYQKFLKIGEKNREILDHCECVEDFKICGKILCKIQYYRLALLEFENFHQIINLLKEYLENFTQMCHIQVSYYIPEQYSSYLD